MILSLIRRAVKERRAMRGSAREEDDGGDGDGDGDVVVVVVVVVGFGAGVAMRWVKTWERSWMAIPWYVEIRTQVRNDL